ncbi:MAG TPA: hypothetical protein VMU42_09945, partial [Candidatus Sulfotelmatobacter sp.]|nr:hypothetical protein [Candidatus Sulfotelmatobacter sp.]
MIRRLTIRTRLVLLTSLLIFAIAASNLYLVRKLTGNTVALATAMVSAAVVEQANDTRIAFGEMRYWLTDLALSRTPIARTSAAAAREEASRYLDVLAVRRPELVADIRKRLADFEQAGLAAVDAYAVGNQPAGNQWLTEARGRGQEIDDLLASLAVDL